ncbi:helix-turn-helix transcriptional regulator [Pseudomonas fuscovaginae UPB0736]|uniref:Phage repressor protein C, contains Cro/C1-type HTH and peptisase s24 domains n=1 Tax=Pseudomonas asplenii TaxID=53407 RepID=A0A1H6MSY6_9PSED|nr:helix-turn-helix transcriptional regulator [Pseudomonas fuscovaginae]UUQ63010.1 helix-turn-helix transcriptional regulator [Pseudomonas fuscovaginae UPB0736]SEI01790.1 Phage repressor protein C, contains Cro/C1-type HTH and peptisase s24 domains [Pseudomonas fuscovaginae]
MNTSGDRLRALLRECHLSASDFAANRQVTPQHVNNWFKRGIPMARMDEIAELLCVNSRWLRTGDGPKHPGTNTSETEGELPAGEKEPYSTRDDLAATEGNDVQLPLYKETPTGPGSRRTQVTVIPGRKVRLPYRILQAMGVEPDKAICAPMIGNSMAEKIEDGSTIAIDRSLTQVVDGEIYALEHDGMLRVKYVYRLPAGALRLRSHNSEEYPDEVFSADEIERQGIQILGWVFWWSTLNKRRPPVPFK